MTPEEYERWHVRNCARCGRRAAKSAEWSDGPICRTCYERAMRVHGRCPSCRADRLLPGLDTAGTPICRDCAGITRDFFCDRCGFEGLLLGGRLCERCTLADTLGRLLDNGTGRVAPSLQPLITSLLKMDRPKSRLIWLRNPNVVRLLRGLATGSIPLTHEGLHQEAPWRTVTHLRDLLTDSGVLPRVDRQLLLYQRWPTERLATLEDPNTTGFSGTSLPGTRCADYGPRRRRAAGTLSEQSGETGDHPGWRLPYLARQPRPHHRALSAGRPRRLVHREARHPAPSPDLPPLVHEDGPHAPPHPSNPGHHPGPGTTAPAPPTRHPRTGPLRRLPAPAERTVAAFVLLYAQPVSRIVRLTIDDITDDGTTVAVRRGDPSSPLPEPIAKLMRAYIHSRQHLPYTSSRSARWLFPVRQPGQPINPVSLQAHLREIGVPPQRGRNSAIRQLVLQVPALVIAKALGHHDKTATRLVTEAGGTWSRYAPGIAHGD